MEQLPVKFAGGRSIRWWIPLSLAIFNDLGKDLPKLDPSLKLGVQNTTPILVRVPGELALPFSNFW